MPHVEMTADRTIKNSQKKIFYLLVSGNVSSSQLQSTFFDVNLSAYATSVLVAGFTDCIWSCKTAVQSISRLFNALRNLINLFVSQQMSQMTQLPLLRSAIGVIFGLSTVTRVTRLRFSC